MGLLSRAAELITEDSGEDSKTLKDKIAQYHRRNADFNCIVLEIPNSTGKDKINFCEKVSGIIHTAGIVIPLPSGRPLILLPPTINRELIVHRLSKSLNTSALSSFEAEDTETVLSRIHSIV